uniref:Uncharacterized protein n=1 Tax=Aegilops tauschii subsp. strangulata TaxID=200361 RepID=A0A453CKD0_AEGTS
MTREKRPDLLTKVWPVVEPLIRKPPAAPWPYVQSAVTGSYAPNHLICPISMVITFVSISIISNSLGVWGHVFILG